MRKLRREFDARESDPSFKQSFLEYRAYRLHELKQEAQQQNKAPKGPEADAEQTDDYYFWRLHLHADVPGVNLDRKYNIPVMTGFKESQAIDHDLSAQVQVLRSQQAEVEQVAIERGRLFGYGPGTQYANLRSGRCVSLALSISFSTR